MPSPPPPPGLTCANRRAMVQAWFDQQPPRVQPLRDRVAAGTGPDSTLFSVNVAYSLGEPPCDHGQCGDRSAMAMADAQEWLDGLDLTVQPAELACQSAINAIDCSSPNWPAQAADAESSVQLYANYLYQKDQELGSLEASWSQIVAGCPVPAPGCPMHPAGPTVPGG